MKQPLLNAWVNNLNWEEALREIDGLIAGKEPSYLTEVNVDVLVKMEEDPYLKRIVNEADLTLVDGQPLIWISRLGKEPVKAKISGSDLAWVLSERAEKKGYSIFILGGGDGAADEAAGNLRRKFPNLNIAGTCAPAWGFEQDEQEKRRILEAVLKAGPDLLFVCLGCPKQEKWIYENYRLCGAKLSLCSGGTVDFIAGRVKRAPKWMSAWGMEWFYRFLKEPRRLFRRYFIENMKIWSMIWKYGKQTDRGNKL